MECSPHAHTRPPLGQQMRSHQQRASDDTLEQSNRRSDRVLESLDPLAIDPGVDNIADAVHGWVVEDKDLLESGTQQVADVEHGHQRDHWYDGRHAYVPHAL